MQQANFFANTEGLNLTDSPFNMSDGMASGGYNYDYALTGGIRKRFGHTKLASSPDAQLKTLGWAQLIISGTRNVLRFAGSQVQLMNSSTYAFTALTEDTAAATSSLFDSTTLVSSTGFNTASNKIAWFTGGGLTDIYGAYSGTKFTKNGAVPPTGAITLTPAGADGTIPAGTYFYAVALRKESTQQVSNVALDLSVVIGATNHVTIDLTGLTGVDATKYDKIVIYRSAISGVTGFTTGSLVTSVNVGTASYIDTGSVTASAVNVPRANSALLDYSVITAGNVSCTTAFKRRLVAAIGNTVYFSDLNTPEAWPVLNSITVPSSGDITALASISYATTNGQDEYLAIFKERELWIVTGNSLSDWVLKFVDNTGCLAPNLCVSTMGFLAFIDYRGVYLWDGSQKPLYCSRLVETLFAKGGSLNKSLLQYGWGAFSRKNNAIYWYISHNITGIQKYALKLDLRLTVPKVEDLLAGRVLDAVFIQDSSPFALTGGFSFQPAGNYEEMVLAGDDAGYIYNMYDGPADGSSGIDFSYETKYLDMGLQGITKRYHKIIVWVEENSLAALTLDWWTNYKSAEGEKSTRVLSVESPTNSSYWDVAFWDVAYWSPDFKTYTPLVFNLDGSQYGTEGDCIKIRFSQTSAAAPVNIAAFSVIFTPSGSRK